MASSSASASEYLNVLTSSILICSGSPSAGNEQSFETSAKTAALCLSIRDRSHSAPSQSSKTTLNQRQQESDSLLQKIHHFNHFYLHAHFDSVDAIASAWTSKHITLSKIRKLDSAWIDIIIAHLKVMYCLASNPSAMALQTAYEHQLSLVQTFQSSLFLNLNRSSLPVLYTINADLANLAVRVDSTTGGSNKCLTEAARIMNKSFSLCVTDRFSAPQESRKWGTYAIASLLFQAYFKLSCPSLCTNILKSLGASEMPALEAFPIPHQVAFHYYQSILLFQQERYPEAEVGLTFALRFSRNAQARDRTMRLLLPIKLLQAAFPAHIDQFPSAKALYSPFLTSVQRGDLAAFEEAFEEQTPTLLTLGVWTVMERVRLIIIRQLFRKVWVIEGKESRVPFERFLVALEFVGYFKRRYHPPGKPVLSAIERMDDVECLLANLIDKGFLKGYLSQEKQIAVLAKTNPFPPLVL